MHQDNRGYSLFELLATLTLIALIVGIGLPSFAGIAARTGMRVEIDALFAAPRDGRETLFLVEAKVGPPTGDLAKHKLVYPYAALRSELPATMDIVPVYLKAWAEGDDRHFLIVECELDGGDTPVVNGLRAMHSQHLVLPKFT